MTNKTTRGIVLKDYGQTPTLEEIEILDPGMDEVRVQIAASGICHTDLGYMRDARSVPVLLGHEGAGIIAEVGANVTHTKPGDHVVINWQAKCQRCRHCLSGRQDLCEDIQSTAAPRVFWQKEPISVMLNAGTFSPWVVVPASGAIPIPEEMPLDKAALIGCGVATGVGAALFTAAVQPGESVAVFGVGGVGLNTVQGARLANAGKIIALDLDDTRLAQAQHFGATHTINNQSEAAVEAVRDLTKGRGVDHVFEVTGLSDLMLAGIDMLARGGTLTLIGAADRDAVLPLLPRRFMSQQQRLLGCIYGNIRPEIHLPLFAEWYLDGRLLLDALHTHSLSLDDVPAYFEAGNHEGIRSVVQFEDT